jgi:hypothetical protein
MVGDLMYVNYKKIKNKKYSSTIKGVNKEIINNLKNSYFSEFLQNNRIKSPPTNQSLKTRMELEYLSELPENREFVEKYDDGKKVFMDFLSDINEKVNEAVIDTLIEESSKVVNFYKNLFNRPRPKQLGRLYNIELGEVVELSSMKTPAYPSGHSVQGFLLAKVLSDAFPKHKKELIDIGKKISYSRQIGRAHYPSDSKAGEKLGLQLYKEYIKNQNVD